MPMTPSPGESEQDFMHRCVSEEMDAGHEQDQAVAICMNIWSGKDGKPAIQKAYSLLSIKSLEVEQRVIEGIASTPEPDSYNDIVELDGIDYTLPIPLLYQHNARQPIGWVNELTKRDGKLLIKAKIAQENPVIPHIAEAWAMIRAGLIRGLSIGFRSIEDAFLKDTGGIHFLKSKLVEISAVTIPANESATILAVKSAVKPTRHSVTVHLPDLSGNNKIPVGEKMSFAQQIKTLEGRNMANRDRIAQIMTMAGSEGRTRTTEEIAECDTLTAENDSLLKDITQLRSLEADNIQKAVPVVDHGSNGNGTSVIYRGTSIPVRVESMLPKGVRFARAMQALAHCRGNRSEASEYARKTWLDTPEVADYLTIKANIEPGTTSGTTWAAPLVPTATTLPGEFFEMLRAATVLGQMNPRRVPFNVAVPAQTGGATVSWVGEKQAKPVSSLAFSTVTLTWSKVACIVTITEELAKLSSPDAEMTVRNSLIADLATYLDQQLLDPTVGPNGNISPASITWNVTPRAASGVNYTAFLADMQNLLTTLLTANEDPRNFVVIMPANVALNLSLMVNSLNQNAIPTISLTGGTVLGMRVIVSNSVGSRIVIVNESDLLVASDPNPTVDVSREASIVMTDTPEASPAATSLVSLWQRNLIGLKVEQFIRWQKGRTTTVGYISNAVYSTLT